MYPDSEIIISEITLVAHNGESLPLHQMFTGMEIYENIYSPFLTGSISIEDTFDHISRLPIVGQERLFVQFRSGSMPDQPDTTITQEFAVYKVSNLRSPKGNIQTYTLNFTTPEAIYNTQTKISKAYSDISSNIAQDLLENQLKTGKDIFIEPSAYQQNVVFPYWSPMTCLKWLCRRAISTEYKDPTYMFYETTRGFNFRTIESLLDNPTTRKSIFFDDMFSENSNTPEASNSASDLVIVDAHDTLENTENGLYGGRLYCHDPIKKKFQTFDYNYIDEFKETVHIESSKSNVSSSTLGTNTLCPPNAIDGFGNRVSDYPLASQHIHPSHAAIFDSGTGVEQLPDRWLLQRKSRLAQLSDWQIAVTMKGDSRMNVGDLIEVELPLWDTTQEAGRDRYYDGRYLLTAIRHYFTFESYDMDMDLIKDSVNSELK